MVSMTVQPKHILRGDVIEHAGATCLVWGIEVTPRRNYKFMLKCQETGAVNFYYYRPTDTVKLLSI